MQRILTSSRLFVLPLLALLFVALPLTQASAHEVAFDQRATELMESNLKIKIVIIIIIKKKKKGFVEATGIKLATEETKPAANQVLAESYVENGKLGLKIKRFNIGMPPTVMLIPEGFLMPKQAALKMGYKAGAFKLKAGKIQLKPNSLGNFEVQDL
ncbi:MAG: hypothetical protein AAFQ68_11315 [Bacteroidota bacterium]